MARKTCSPRMRGTGMAAIETCREMGRPAGEIRRATNPIEESVYIVVYVVVPAEEMDGRSSMGLNDEVFGGGKRELL
ncbi:hypothetical protein B296_00035887 [Ensete ventricosum]|uniref:Uncharacterized protein n=1 Tax=Ensete ventricosum TaxID=4639 RepID=A0A426X1F5_ENSVE|nr:hypothetical protein B296_00035887 [Ensete ventricosum]